MSSEDTETMSGAGKYTSILGASNFHEFRQAIHEVIESGRDSEHKAVLIQPVIQGHCSGVMFTEAPTNPDHMMIESIYGLAEPLVSGRVIPDHFEVKRTTGMLQKANISTKKAYGIFASPQDSISTGQHLQTQIGKIRCILPFKNKFIGNVSFSQSNLSSLKPEQLSQLHQIGLELEQFFQKPQDVEWTIDDKGICILQARDITTTSHMPLPTTNFKKSTLNGLPASSGSASGPVSKFDGNEMKWERGKKRILVAYETNPKIIYHLDDIGGIVTEVGGMLCHAAIVAREIGLPCVVGVQGAMKHLEEDDFVTINGTDGWVLKGDSTV